MKEDLAERVIQFNLMELPGQPKMMHMGTSYLVNDLDREVRRLKKQTAIAHHALKYLIESNKVSAATRIYYANGAYNTLGNIRAEMPAGTDAEEK